MSALHPSVRGRQQAEAHRRRIRAMDQRQLNALCQGLPFATLCDLETTIAAIVERRLAAKEAHERRITAVHEAGHAVMCHLQKRAYRYVTIRAEQDSCGHLALRPLPSTFQPDLHRDSRTRNWVERELMVMFAGPVCEAIHRGQSVGHDDDFRRAARYAAALFFDHDELRAYVRWLWQRTDAIFRLPWHWAAVEAVAEELMQDETIRSHVLRPTMESAIAQAAEAAATNGWPEAE